MKYWFLEDSTVNAFYSEKHSFILFFDIYTSFSPMSQYFPLFHPCPCLLRNWAASIHLTHHVLWSLKPKTLTTMLSFHSGYGLCPLSGSSLVSASPLSFNGRWPEGAEVPSEDPWVLLTLAQGSQWLRVLIQEPSDIFGPQCYNFTCKLFQNCWMDGILFWWFI